MLRGLWYTHPKEVLGETWLKQTDCLLSHRESSSWDFRPLGVKEFMWWVTHIPVKVTQEVQSVWWWWGACGRQCLGEGYEGRSEEH